jgi:hypothetical protein
MKALQFVAPAPEHHDIDVAILARHIHGSSHSGSTGSPSIQGIAAGEDGLARCLLKFLALMLPHQHLLLGYF